MLDDVDDFQTYITKDPPVVETNKAHGTVPHPSFATMIDENHVVQLLEHHIHSKNRGNEYSDHACKVQLNFEQRSQCTNVSTSQ